MMRYNIMLPMTIIIFIGGCHSSYDQIMVSDAPYCGGKNRSLVYAKTRTFTYSVNSLDVYIGCKGPKTDIEDIIHQCEQFLETSQYSNTIEPVFGRNEIVWSPEEQRPLIAKIVEDMGIDLRYTNTKTIVCLNPIVVIITDEPRLMLPYIIIALNDSYIDQYQTMIICRTPLQVYTAKDGAFLHKVNGVGLPHIARMGNPENDPSIILNKGYRCSTKFKGSRGIYWFSPDLRVPPRPVEMLSSGQGIIQVPWGRLILTKKDDEWIISTENKQ